MSREDRKKQKKVNVVKTILITLGVIFGLILFFAILENLQPSSIPESNDLQNNQETNPIIEKPSLPEAKATTSETNIGKLIQRKFTWNYENQEWFITFNLNKTIYDVYKQRSRNRDYDLFASDLYSNALIDSLATSLKNIALEGDINSDKIPYFIISFVQSFPYTSDKIYTGYDEYPKFPYETIYDNGGDCEDTAILTVALLQKLGYGAVLLEFPEHMAVGVKCADDMEGYSVQYLGQRYCYLETTNIGWAVGSMPDELKNKQIKIIPVYKKPVLDVNFTYTYRYGLPGTFVDVDAMVINLGSEKAGNVKIYVALQTTDTNKVWDSVQSESIQIEPEESYSYNVTNLHAPYNADFRVYVRAFGDNVISGEYAGNWLEWN